MPPKPQKVESALERVLAMRGGGGHEWYSAHMDAYYEQSEQPRIDPGWFHPSALDHVCDAFLAFEFLGLPQPAGQVSAQLRRIFDNGHSSEARKQEAIKRAGLARLSKKERSFEIPQYRVRGECDNIIKHPLTGELWIWEHKTMREDRFDALKAPLPAWVTQCHFYMFGKGVLQTLVEVECKNCQAVKTFAVPFDGALWKKLTGRLERILARLGERQEIARTPVPRDSECPFYSQCAGYDFGAAR